VETPFDYRRLFLDDILIFSWMMKDQDARFGVVSDSVCSERVETLHDWT
jgi:hypothetical protein